MRGVVRRAKAAAQLARANFGRLETPAKVNLCVTYWCQYRCRTCNIWRRRPAGELTTRELLQFVSANRGIRWLDLMGGEIFLRPDIGEIFDAVSDQWADLALLHFATNGFLTDRIVAHTARTAARTKARVIVTVSVDGDEELNDTIRGVRGGFRRQIETFQALRRLPGVETVLGMTLSRHNVDQVQRTFEACRRECPDLHIGDFHVNVAQRSPHYYDNERLDVAAAPGATRAALRDYRRLRATPTSASAWVESRYLGLLDRYLETGVTPMKCHALRSSCFINPDGDVYPCITDARRLGSLRDTGMALAPIWTGRAAAETQQDIWSGRCPQCWTACEAYQSILGNLVRPGTWLPARSL